MQIPLLLFIAFIMLNIGFVTAWLLQSQKINRQKTGFESTINQILDEKNTLENQFLVTKERLNIRTDEMMKIQTELSKVNILAENRGMELAGIQSANKNLQEKLEQV